MKVSILVPIYGVEQYIERCARSLMEQTYDDIEYVFVNDCTPDKSIDVLNSTLAQYPARAQQVRIINHSKNCGIGGTRQDLIEAASGKAVLFVDSDDYLAKGAVEQLVAAMQRQAADIVDGGYSIVTSGVVACERQPLHATDEKYLKTILCQNVDPNRLWGRLIKLSLFKSNGIGFVNGVNYSEDFAVLPRLLLLAKRGWVDDNLYYYRDDNPLSYTNNISTSNVVSYLKAQQIVGDFMRASEHWSKYQFAAEMGWIGVWRFARRFDVPRRLVDEHFKLKPSCVVTRCLMAMIKADKLPFSISDFFYKAVRRLFLSL